MKESLHGSDWDSAVFGLNPDAHYLDAFLGNLKRRTQNIFDPLLRLANRLGLVPYYLGRSYTVRELREELERAGLIVEETTAILHNPRLTAVGAIALARKLNWPRFTRLVQRTLMQAQRLEKTPLRYYTGSFVAAKARRA